MARRKKKKPAKAPAPADRATGRFTAAEKAEILKQLDAGRTKTDLARQYGTTTVTIRRWEKAREAARGSGDGTGDAGLIARSTRPLTSPNALGPVETKLVLDTKGDHPEMGPAQIRNQLRRFHGVSISHKVIGKVLRDAGHELEKRVGDREAEAVERFEMSRPNELWTMDIKDFYVHDLKVYLITIIDDFSRLVIAHRLGRSATADDAIATVKDGIARHGKPERVLSDRGPQFHAWRGEAEFTKFLASEMIEHSLARPHHPQTCGKIEALHRTLEKELIGVVRFDSFAHAQRELDRYYERYNFERTHMGIGGATPADRYFGRTARVMAALEGSAPPVDQDAGPRLPGERAVVLQLALVEGRVELWFAGKRIVLG
jgi:transposase InsO family protein